MSDRETGPVLSQDRQDLIADMQKEQSSHLLTADFAAAKGNQAKAHEAQETADILAAGVDELKTGTALPGSDEWMVAEKKAGE